MQKVFTLTLFVLDVFFSRTPRYLDRPRHRLGRMSHLPRSRVIDPKRCCEYPTIRFRSHRPCWTRFPLAVLWVINHIYDQPDAGTPEGFGDARWCRGSHESVHDLGNMGGLDIHLTSQFKCQSVFFRNSEYAQIQRLNLMS
jgi:hypothetical protein